MATKHDECHCGRDGHALNSVNCPVHGEAARAKLAEVQPGTPAAHTIPVDAAALSEHRRSEVAFAADQEPMSIYRFDDGSVLKAKLVLMHVDRIEGAYNPDGTPMYNVTWQQVMNVIAAPEMRRK